VFLKGHNPSALANPHKLKVLISYKKSHGSYTIDGHCQVNENGQSTFLKAQPAKDTIVRIHIELNRFAWVDKNEKENHTESAKHNNAKNKKALPKFATEQPWQRSDTLHPQLLAVLVPVYHQDKTFLR
jgi:hypothetical protein